MPKYKILLIEDDWDIAQITLLALALDSRIEARHIQDGDEAIRVVRYGRWRPDLILTDLMMPGLSGLEVLSILKREGLKNMPVVLMTAKTVQEAEARYRENGVDAVITKPFDPLTLSQKLVALMDKVA